MAFSRFRLFLSNSPKLTNAIVYGSLYGGGEFTQQTIQGRSEYDWASVRRIATVGACLGPVYSVWYTRLDKALPGNATKTVVKKLVLDQGLAGIFGVTAFFGGTAALEGKSFDGVLEDLKTKGPKAYVMGWVYWPIVQMVNFRFLPTNLRAPYVGVAAFVWTNVLCFIKSVKVEQNTEFSENVS